MTDRQINKLLRKEFSILGWLLLAYYLLLNTLVTVQMMVDSAGQILQNLLSGRFLLELDFDALINNGWGYFAAAVVAFVILYAWKGADYWRDEIFHREKKMTFGVFFCAACLCIGGQMISTIWLTALELLYNLFDASILTTLEQVSGSNTTFSMVIYGALVAPISEEIVFRGFILRSLRPYGRRFAIFGSALLFALFHGNLLQGPFAFLVGLIMGYLACEYSIKWAIALHVFNNLILAEGLTRLLEVLPYPVADVVNMLIFGGFFAVSILILNVKKAQILEYNQGEWIDRRCVKCLLTSPGILVFALLMTGSAVAWMLA
ncbi:MAG: CPBP family intramembrane metalloprotease [Oscillospiraceae bacterium]|nr:CPBP family intramembrane metalloprotease [Oscillospiraceae bacterium]